MLKNKVGLGDSWNTSSKHNRECGFTQGITIEHFFFHRAKQNRTWSQAEQVVCLGLNTFFFSHLTVLELLLDKMVYK